MTLGYDKPLYTLPFDHRGSFQKKLFGWEGALTAEQTAEIAAAKQVTYDSFKAALAAGVDKEKAGILVDKQWLTTAAGVRGFIGFAVGRTVFWDPLVSWRGKKITKGAAVPTSREKYQRI